MPFIRRSSTPAERLESFHRIEGRFAPQAAFWVLIAGASGFWMTWRADLWWRFADPQYWWMHAMAAVWLFFAVMLFALEPLVLHRRMANRSEEHTSELQSLMRIAYAVFCLK